MDKERELTEEEKNDQNPEQNTISPASEHLQEPADTNGTEKDDIATTSESTSVEDSSVELVQEEEAEPIDEITEEGNQLSTTKEEPPESIVGEEIQSVDEPTDGGNSSSTNVEESAEVVDKTEAQAEEKPTDEIAEPAVELETAEPAVESETAEPAVESETAEPAVESETAVQDPTPQEVALDKTTEEETKPSEEVVAPLTSQEDLKEHAHDEHGKEHDEEVDYSTYSKEELVEVVKAAGKADNVVKADLTLQAIRPFFDEIRDKERKEVYDKFIAEGGEADNFEFKNDELNTRFDANYRLIKDRKSKYYQEKEKQKDLNLAKKQELLEKIREFIDSDETNISFDTFKALQNEWKNIGQVPAAFNRTLWANYNALMDRFYDKRSIYFELKELDRRKNLESKIELCVKAENLVKHDKLNEAIAQLNELHHEYKHIGPVPNEEREDLWQRFKAASDAVYERRKGYVEELKVQFEENLVKKSALGEEVQQYTAYNSDRIKEWNEKTKEILALQKQWEAIGGMPKEKGKEINKKFWSGFKTFFHHKGEFFKRLDVERGDNLKLKEELVSKAEQLRESKDWIKTANEFKKLQRDWKEIGPVPEKHRNEVYKRFKSACDFFFDQKRDNSKEIDKEYDENLKLKEEICAKIEELAKSDSAELDNLRELQEAFNNVGFVPKKAMGSIKSKYSEAVDRFINAIQNISNEERHDIRLENQLNKMLNEPNAEQKIFRKEQHIRKQIGKVENDIALWKNNIEFFAKSKTADKLKDEFDQKIEDATKELQHLKQQLRMLRSTH